MHMHNYANVTIRFAMCLVSIAYFPLTYYIDHYLAPGGGCEVLFSPGLCVCLSVYLCVRPIFWYFISRLLEEISI